VPQYKVLLAGKNCHLRVAERRWGIFRRFVVQPHGFFTTRWVETDSPDQARDAATELLVEEFDRGQREGWFANPPDQPWYSAVREIWEDPEGFAQHAPGRGYTWYLEGDDDEDDDREPKIRTFELRS